MNPYGLQRIYFIKPIGMNGPIKIGRSESTDRRLDDLMAWSPFPLEIIVEIPSLPRLEGRIQSTFEQHHLHREWFTAAPEILSLIEKLKAGVPIEEAVTLSDRVKGTKSFKKPPHPKLSVVAA